MSKFPICQVGLNCVQVDLLNIDTAKIFDPWIPADQVFDALSVANEDRRVAIESLCENQRKTKQRYVKQIPGATLLHPVAVVLIARIAFPNRIGFTAICTEFYLNLRAVVEEIILPRLTRKDRRRLAAMCAWLTNPEDGTRH